jgi:WD40 repeat protein
MSFSRFSTDHNAFIHDLAYDYYGRRLATCSSDKKIKVWDQKDGKWVVSTEIKEHNGSVYKISWAHPEYGQVLASCSADGDVNIYEEQINANNPNIRNFPKRGRLVDSRVAVRDVQFAPKHQGLKLAACSQDGKVRIYICRNLMNLAEWSLVEEFTAADPCNSICWNPSPFDGSMIVVAAGSKVEVWEDNGRNRWQVTHTLTGHTDIVHHVDWAPQMGRGYHLIATACKDRKVRVFKVYMNRPSTAKTFELVATMPDHNKEVWRVSWNVTGTILASTGDDGTVRLWKADFRGNYGCTLLANNSEVDSQTADRLQDRKTQNKSSLF